MPLPLADRLKIFVKNALGIHSWNADVDQERLIPDPRVIFDIGANKGVMATKYCELFPNAHVYCFEPLPATYQILRQNVGGNSRIETHQMAMSDSRGTVDMHVTKSDLLHSLLPPSGEWNDSISAVSVKTETIDEFCAERGIEQIDLLKIDVQGHEMAVFHGAKRMFENRAIRNVFCEVNFNSMYEGGAIFKDVDDFLRLHGFHLYGIYGLTPAWGEGYVLAGDGLYLLRPDNAKY